MCFWFRLSRTEPALVQVTNLLGGGMEVEGTLTVLAEIAIAIAGFSGIVAGVSRGAGSEWTVAERLSLSMLLQISLSVAFFSLFPLVLASSDIDSTYVWQISSAGWLVSVVASVSFALRRFVAMLKGTPSPPPGGSRLFATVALGGVTLAIGVQVANTILLCVPWPHLSALLWGLVVSASLFARLLRGRWNVERPAAEQGTAADVAHRP